MQAHFVLCCDPTLIALCVLAAALAQEAERSLTVEALTALDTEAQVTLHTGRPSDLDNFARSMHDAPCISPAHTASTQGEMEPAAPTSAAAAAVVAIAAAESSALDLSVSTATTPAGAAALNAAAGKDARKSRFKVVKVVESVKGADIGSGPPSVRPSTETVPPAPGSTPGSMHGGMTAIGVNVDALAIINQKLQVPAPSQHGYICVIG